MRKLGKKGIVLCLSLLVISSMCFNGGINVSAEEEAQTGHEHTQACYATAGQLLCNIQEEEGHTHDETCRDASGNLTCGQEERQGHAHGEGCYATGSELICGFEEDQNEASDESVSASESVTNEETAQEEANSQENQEETTEDKKEEVSADAVASIGNIEYRTLAEAIDAVKDGETVCLWKDVKENIQTKNQNYTLDLQGHQIEPASGNTEDPIYYVSGGNVTLKNGTLANGNAAYGGLWISDAVFTGEDLTIKNNTSTKEGGALYIQGSSVSLVNCQITGNCSAKNGAGISLFNESSLVGSGIIVSNNSFTKKKNSSNGGGIYIKDTESVAEIKDDSVISDNEGYKGAGIYSQGKLKLENCTISGNKASDAGGGIYAKRSSKSDKDNEIEIQKCKILNNNSKTGGGLEISGCKTFITDTEIKSNKSTNAGAAAKITYSSSDTNNKTTYISNTEISDNISEKDVVLFLGSKPCEDESDCIQLKGCSIYNNKGKTIMTSSGHSNGDKKGKLLIENGSITNNVSNFATIYNMAPEVKIKDSIIKNNSATGSGLNYSEPSKATGGICVTEGPVEMEGGAVYNNRTATDNKANDWYVRAGKTVTIIPAKDMKDGKADFKGYVWQDNQSGAKFEESVSTPEKDLCLTAVFGVERDIAKIGDETYQSIVSAVEAANENDTIVLIAGENDEYGTKIYSDPVAIEKNVTIDVNERTISVSDKEAKKAFNVRNNGTLTLKGSGQINGEISVEGGSSLNINGSLKLGKIVHEGKELVLNAAMDKLSVDLSQGSYVTAGEAFDCGELKLTLADAVLEQLNDETPETPDVRVVKCENEEQAKALAKKINLVGLENNLVTLKYIDGFLTLHKDKLDGVFLDGANGSDENSGLAYNAPVKTFEKAKEVLSENPEQDTIYVLGQITLNDERAWELEDGKKLVRYPNYKGYLVCVNSKLTLTNIVIDGASDFGVNDANSMISVSGSAALYIEKGTILQNNNTYLIKSRFGYGGAISNSGSLVMNDGVIQNCKAEGGGAIYCQQGIFTLNGGSIINNYVLNEKPNGSRYPSGGGIYINQNGQMIMNGGLIEKNKAGWGGGIALGGNNNLSPTVEVKDPEDPNKKIAFESFIMNGGTISKNESSNCGGGIHIQCTFNATIYKGNITGNVSKFGHFGGGGIYVNGGRSDEDGTALANGRLQVYNACITDNTAELGGGGIAGCNTSDIRQFVIKGGLIYGNDTKDGQKDDILVSNSDGANYFPDPTKSYISEFMLGGGTYMWKWTGTDKYIGLNYLHAAGAKSIYNDLTDDDPSIDAGKGLAQVYITGNYASYRGGGIGSNGDVIIGTNPEKDLINISVKKIWEDNDNKYETRPGRIWVWLLRNGERVSCVEFRDDIKGWPETLTFTDQPKYDENGKEYVYTIEEDTENLYGKYISTVQQDEEDKTSWTVTNTLASLTVSKTVSGRGDKLKEFTFTVTLDDKTINGIYGDMEFKDGIATFTLRDGEHKSAGNLPNGTKYTVSESDNGGYVVTVNGEAGDRAEGTVVAGKPVVMAFDNYKGGGTTPENPDTPDTPNPPDTPDNPNKPLPPDDPLIPDEPDTPDNPDKPLPPDDPLIDEPETPSQPDEAVQTENPKTGDESNLLPWAVLLAVGAAGITGVVRVRKKKNS